MAEIELPQDLINRVKADRENLNAVSRFITKAKSAGIDVGEREKRVNDDINKLNKIKNVFDPNG